MTPITDHARINRERLINGDEAARRMHFQALVKLGIDEVEAANRAGWHPAVPVDRFIRRFGWTLVVGCVAALLILYATTTAANMEHKDRVVSAANMEEALARCLNGERIELSDGTKWFCLRSGK